MGEEDIVQLRARLQALETAVAVNLMVDAMNRGESDLRHFGEGRRKILAAVADIAGQEPDGNSALAAALNNFGDTLAKLTAGLSDDWASALRVTSHGEGDASA